MPNTFNPDEFIKNMGAAQSPQGIAPQYAAQPTGMQPTTSGFNPDAFMAAQGIKPEMVGPIQPAPEMQGPPTIDQAAAAEADYKNQVMAKNPPTPLSAAVHGFESGVAYNLADEAAAKLDPEAAMRFRASQEEYPILYGLSNLVGAVLSPSPFGKLTALKNASLGLKAAGAFGRVAAETGSSAYGASEKSGLEALKEAGQAMSNPVTLGLGAISGAGATLPGLIGSKALTSVIAKKGDVAYGLGRTMDDALSSEAGQEAVTRLANNFADDTVDMIKSGRKAISSVADEVASKNVDTRINVLDRFKSFGDKLENLKADEMTADEQIARNMLNRWRSESEGLFATNSSSGKLDQSQFQDIYTRKQILGDMIFDSSRNKFNKAPELKAEAVKLYSDLSKQLSSADVTGNFKHVSDAYNTLYKTADVLDGFGNKVMSMDNRLSASGLRAKDDLKKTWNTLSPELRQKWFPELDHRVNNALDQVVDIVGVTKKASGKSPADTSFMNEVMRRLPVFSETSRLNMLNKLGRESANSMNPALLSLTNVLNPSRGLSVLEKGAQGAKIPVLSTTPSEEQR